MANDTNTQEQEQDKRAAKEAKDAEKAGFVNAHGQPRTKPVNHDGNSIGLGEKPAPKYEEKAENLDPIDPLAGAIPGSDLAAATADPESPHLGGEYIPGSANTNEERSRFEGVATGPPQRVK